MRADGAAKDRLRDPRRPRRRELRRARPLVPVRRGEAAAPFGLNMLHGETGWDRAAGPPTPPSTLIGDNPAGRRLGARGAMQTSLGYIHREVKGQNLLWGLDSKPDSMVAFSFSIRPH